MHTACIAVALGVFAYAGAARAQLIAPSALPGQSGSGGPTQTGQDTSKPNDFRAIKTRDKTARLFDLSTSVSSLQVDLGPIWYRPATSVGPKGFERGTGELAIGTVTTSKWKPFYLAGHHKVVLRAFDSKSYAGSFSSDFATGAYLGPIEIESRIGLNILNLSAFHGEWSADMISPRVSVGAAVHLWRFRVDIQAHSEYLWRWFGNDYLVRGVTLGIRLDLPRSDPPVMKKSSSPG